uniref:non-specific serine/threonine protein kinase n=1 Tax=Sedum alfredii TaxID=439688 RepID=A0A410N646_9MAGN|nr:LRR receptor-like serine/threonine-protein kinase [Sedum alfredii]
MCPAPAGTLPHEIGSLNELEILYLPVNQFIGEIPFEIFNNTKMTYISLTSNLLTGELPPTMGLNLPNIQTLILTNNSISGTIPRFISNATNLIQLDLGFNSFTGYIPDTLGDLRLLEWLSLGSNNLRRDPSDPGLGFLTSLTKCRNLVKLGFEVTALDAALPNSIGNFSSSLQQFFAYGCQLIGSIPDEIGNLSNLVTLQLWYNKLTGYIPATLGKLQELQDLGLSGNNLIGPIPFDIFRIRNLAYLRLRENELSGAIPQEIGNLTSIRMLVLGANKFTSTIPSTLWSLKDVLNLDLTSNLLTGHIPMELVNLKSAWQIGLSGNQFTGSIPEFTKDLGSLLGLFLDSNRLQGPIPDSISNLIGLEYLDLSNNSLEGAIPKSVTKLVNLKNFNVSFNNLTGEVPSTGPFANFSAELFAMNKGLCGGTPQMQLPPCRTVYQRQQKSSQLLLKIGTPVLAFACLATLLAFLFLWTRWKTKKRSAETQEKTEDSPLAVTRITYQEILQATNGFSESNLLGTGGFGSVYKGMLSNSTTVAIKVFNTQNTTALKSFQSECEILRNIRHKNLVKIISTCTNNLDFMALVLQYMPNGNLSTLLHSHTNSLTLIQRLNIMLDVASAIKYLHHDLPTPVIHCDLKPSNILLDHHMTAQVADFGISKLLSQDQVLTQTSTLATIGYMAPEYGGAGVVTTKGDVYSYGIVLMETMTGKKPTDDEFNGEVSLRDYVKSLLNGDLTEFLEDGLVDESDRRFEECVRAVLSLALNCAEESPARRSDMYDVVLRLAKIREEVLKEDVVQVRRMRKGREEEVGLFMG